MNKEQLSQPGKILWVIADDTGSSCGYHCFCYSAASRSLNNRFNITEDRIIIPGLQGGLEENH